MAKKKTEDKLDKKVRAIAKMEREQERLMAKALDIRHEEAKEAGELGFFARALVLATMPHSKTEEPYFKRVNGNFTLVMIAHPDHGLPYGSVSRLILAWFSTQAVKTKDPEIYLGRSLAEFMGKVGLKATGGERGTLTYFKHHFLSLLTCNVQFTYNPPKGGGLAHSGFSLLNKAKVWREPMELSKATPMPPKVELSKPFFDELLRHPIPIDMRALNALRKSPLAIDIYSWLTYRYHSLKSPVVVPWESLMLQFGVDYGNKRQFRQNFLKQLEKVRVLYPQANITEFPRKGMKLWPSPTHVTPTH